jgi:hypothetical protein
MTIMCQMFDVIQTCVCFVIDRVDVPDEACLETHILIYQLSIAR